MNIFNLLKQDVLNAASKLTQNAAELANIVIEMPRDSLNGDLSTNAAMLLASSLKRPPRDIAMELKEALQTLPYIAHIEIAGPGFINFIIHAAFWQKTLSNILTQGLSYGTSNVGNGKKINVEYVSANPTGPMHIGHARGAVYGDALARLLIKCGFDVTKEYYINDAGAQITVLAESAFLRYQEYCTGEKAHIPEGMYPGEYLCLVGENLAEKYGKQLLGMKAEEYLPLIRPFAVEEMLELIKRDLLQLGIEHDVFTSEQKLHDEGKIEKAIATVEDLGLLYEGTLPIPKGKAQDNWEERSQLLFKSTAYGDDQDRALKKADGSWTYLAGDLAYTADKIERGFDSLILVLGADHGGYVKRMEAITKALSGGKVESDIKICQMVNYVENGSPVKMSKRAGSFSTVRDVVLEVGGDIIRFMMLTRKNDAVLDFDLVKVKEQSKDNPVFYVQYAYVRSKSILANAKEKLPESSKMLDENNIDLTLLSSEEEIRLIKLLAAWPKIVELAAIHFEPHRIALYLQSVASTFHSLWNLGKENNDYRFVIEDNKDLTAARLALVSAMGYVIHSGFDIIGIEVLEKM
ncbi:MAG: arginine--tRNA ligase [Pseudomonadota bacterium]